MVRCQTKHTALTHVHQPSDAGMHKHVRRLKTQWTPNSQPSIFNTRANIRVQVTMHHRLRIGRECHFDQSEAYDIS